MGEGCFCRRPSVGREVGIYGVAGQRFGGGAQGPLMVDGVEIGGVVHHAKTAEIGPMLQEIRRGILRCLFQRDPSQGVGASRDV